MSSATQTVEPTKVCSRCGERQPFSAFYRRRAGEELRESRCKQCSREYREEFVRARPDRVRAYRQSHYQRVKRDPERYAIRLEQGRESKRRTRGTDPRARRVSRVMREAASPDVMVPAGPFAEWLRDRLGDGELLRLARELGMHDRHVRSILKGQAMIALSTVDAALLAVDEPAMLDVLYPLDDAAPLRREQAS